MQKCKDDYVHQPKYVYHISTHGKPRPNSERITNPKLTTQTCESGLIKWFCENVGYLVLGGNMAQNNLSFLHIISQKMISYFYVFGSGVEDWIFGNAYGTSAVTE